MTSVLPGAWAIVTRAAVVKPGERVVVLADAKSRSIGEHFLAAAAAAGARAELVEAPLARGHGEEPPATVTDAVRGAQVVLCATTLSLSHTQFRVQFCRLGGRFLSLADYDQDMLMGGGTLADYAGMVPTVQKIASIFQQGKTARLTSAAGTDMTFHTGGRPANAAPAYCPSPGDFGSPPDIEANFAPVEHLSEGVIVVDGSIPMPELGLLQSPVRVEVQSGRAVSVQGGREAEILRAIWDGYRNPAVWVAAELGVGLNPAARLRGRMLEDEGVLGTAHVGFGANTTIGGRNAAPMHIDLICRQATLTVNGRPVLQNGKLALGNA